jgi:predicted nucleotidyltransferase
MVLKELRKEKGLTQSECSQYIGIPLRTYQNYENDTRKNNSIKYQYILQKLLSYGYVDETHGILDIETIKNACNKVFSEYEISYCYLFGSYAKGKAKENSDVDLLISTPVTGMKYFGLVEKLRVELKKKVDVLNQKQLNDNEILVNEILKDGIKIYG